MYQICKICIVLWTLYATCVLSARHTQSTPEPDFLRHLENLSRRRHPFVEDGKPWNAAREYIIKKFREYGIEDIREQTFNTTITTIVPLQARTETVEGVNIIGLKEGINKTGPVMVVGADYDTSAKGDPFKNNGAGVACLLETLHQFDYNIRQNPYHQNFTIIFVAFDLNTREQPPGEGQPGSFHFVRRWLHNYLRLGHKEFRGALILDSVGVYNTQNHSQTLVPGFEDAFPEALPEIRRRGFKGDFLGFLHRNLQKNHEVVKSFVNHYTKGRRLDPFRLQEMNLHLNASTATESVFGTINHQSHYSFWTNLEPMLPAFLIYDTDIYRSDPFPYTCDENRCNAQEYLTDERERYLRRTTNAVVSTLLDLQATRYQIESSSTRHLPGSFQFILVAASVLLLRQ